MGSIASGNSLTEFFFRQRLLEILNAGGYQPPIIVFVNQKKTADMVAKDLQKAGVCCRVALGFYCL